MNGYCRALAAAVAAACFGGAAQAEGTSYYDDGTSAYDDSTATGAYSDSFVSSDGQTGPALAMPTPRVEYVPVYTERSNTTYYNSGSTHNSYVGASPAYRTYYAPRLVYPAPPPAPAYYDSQPAYAAPPQAYDQPPGLSFTTPAGTYAPFYGGWNSYNSTENVGGYDAYRDTAY
jgi:hypothetical protein